MDLRDDRYKRMRALLLGIALAGVTAAFLRTFTGWLWIGLVGLAGFGLAYRAESQSRAVGTGAGEAVSREAATKRTRILAVIKVMGVILAVLGFGMLWLGGV